MKNLLIYIIFPLTVISITGCTKEDDQPTTVVDIDGNVYQTVTIGNQVWMAENLKVTRFRNGDPLSQITNDQYWDGTTEAAFCSPSNDLALTTDYGRLYNGYAITDIRGLAPEGWHIPTDAEWAELLDHAGGESVAGGKLKEIGFTHWQSPNSDATNEFGFTALPSGVRLPAGDFSDLVPMVVFGAQHLLAPVQTCFGFVVFGTTTQV